MNAKEVKMSPKMAMDLLSRNDHNRPISKLYVAQLVETINRGDWRANAETIKVAKNGSLLDGQHRLQAIVNSGKTVPVLLAEGVDDDVFDTIDTGKRRSAADTLGVMGISEYAAKAAAVRLILILSEDNPTFRENYSNHQIREWVEAFGTDLEPFMPLARKTYGTQLVDKSTVVGLSYFMAQKTNMREIEQFWERVADGAGLAKGHPILALRKRLMEQRMAGKAKLPRQTVIALIIKAWNKTRKNNMLNPRAGLQWREDESFPRIV